MSGLGRGGSRGGAVGKRNGRGGRGTVRSGRASGNNGRFDDSHSPDRRSDESDRDEYVPRFGNYRQPQRESSRSPRRRSASPRYRQNGGYENMRRDEARRPSVDKPKPAAVPPTMNSQTLDPSTVIISSEPVRTEADDRREWHLRLLDADEEVRRAEFQLRRVQLIRKDIGEAYEDFVRRCSVRRHEQQKNKANW